MSISEACKKRIQNNNNSNLTVVLQPNESSEISLSVEKPTYIEQNYKQSFLHGISTVTKDDIDGPSCRACAQHYKLQ